MSQHIGHRSFPSDEVAQAQGMISVQVPCAVDDALVLMQAFGRTAHQTVEQIAIGVVAGEIRFN